MYTFVASKHHNKMYMYTLVVNITTQTTFYINFTFKHHNKTFCLHVHVYHIHVVVTPCVIANTSDWSKSVHYIEA